jgi:hypothetical protein
MLKEQTADCLGVRGLPGPQYRRPASFRSSRENRDGVQISGRANPFNSLRALLHRWKRRWTGRPPGWSFLGVGPPSRKTVKLHAQLQKAESSVITQIRTGRIGLAAFLNKARVPAFPSPVCPCGQARETATHVIMHCERFAGRRWKLLNPRTGQLDVKGLVSKPESVALLAKWFIQLRILPQYSLAEELLYRDAEVGEDGE